LRKSASTSSVRASACDRSACFFLLAIGLSLLLGGCAAFRGKPRQVAAVVRQVVSGDFPQALARLEAQRTTLYSRSDEVLYALDTGLLAFYAGNDELCRERLDRAVRETERLITRSLSGEAGAWLLNDRLLDYRAMLHERRLLFFFSGLSALRQGDADAARVEQRRLDIFLKELHARYGSPLEDSGKERDGPVTDSAPGRWLGMRLYQADGMTDEAAIDFRYMQAVHRVFPAVYPQSFSGVAAALSPKSSGQQRVSLLAFSGRVPEKSAATLYLHTEKDWLFMAAGEGADPVLSGRLWPPVYYPGLEPGIHFKIQVPVLRDRAPGAVSVRFSVDGGPPEPARLLEDTAAAVRMDWKAEIPRTVVRSALRALGKTLAAQQAVGYLKEQVAGKDRFLFSRLLLTGLHSVSEQADLRMSPFFPARIYVHELMLEPGLHRVEVEYADASGRVVFRETREINVLADRINLHEFCHLR